MNSESESSINIHSFDNYDTGAQSATLDLSGSQTSNTPFNDLFAQLEAEFEINHANIVHPFEQSNSEILSDNSTSSRASDSSANSVEAWFMDMIVSRTRHYSRWDFNH